jgi:hypothetical protein
MIPALASLLAGLPLYLDGGLRADFPQDAAPPVYSLVLDLRLFVVPDAFVGVEVGYGGGVDTRNPERVRAAGKLEAVATLGGRLAVGDGFTLGLGGRAGLVRVDGWPRGTLPALHAYGPLVGAEATVGLPLGHAWGHPMGLEVRGGYAQMRLDSTFIGEPSVGVFVTGRLLPDVPHPQPAE